ncbi:RWD-domain-containing protein [Daedaleopsis nitida]|nr:RWD-domain-containing protein [Daedaleopsis nitida]
MNGSSAEQELDECIRLQREEWEVLESIHPECLSSSDACKGSVRLDIPVDLPQSTLVSVHNNSISNGEPSPSNRTNNLSIPLATLPPVLLDVFLPASYPFVPPQIQTLHTTYSWLPINGSDLIDRLIAKWEIGEGVLYTWVEWIRSGDFLDDLGLTTNEKGQRIIRLSHPTPGLLMPMLEKFDQSTQAARFSRNSYECQVCLTSIKGARCILLACSHVFCRSCLEDYWGLCIKEGDIGHVGCPDPVCVKEHREATEEEVRRVVTEEEILRWKWLRMKRDLEKDPTLVHCPMPLCQTPVPRAQNVEEGSPWERLRTCSTCGFSFCSYCKRTWHGPVTHCPISATNTILADYMALADDSPERKRMEVRYGLSTLKRLVKEYEEEREFRAWLEQKTGTPCPGCDLRVEKHSGCNHMTCRCGQHYCYRCGARLEPSQPYKHFSTPGQRCFSKLFDLEAIDDEWQPVEGFDIT